VLSAGASKPAAKGRYKTSQGIAVKMVVIGNQKKGVILVFPLSPFYEKAE
jgi:hypothetical protein